MNSDLFPIDLIRALHVAGALAGTLKHEKREPEMRDYGHRIYSPTGETIRLSNFMLKCKNKALTQGIESLTTPQELEALKFLQEKQIL